MCKKIDQPLSLVTLWIYFILISRTCLIGWEQFYWLWESLYSLYLRLLYCCVIQPMYKALFTNILFVVFFLNCSKNVVNLSLVLIPKSFFLISIQYFDLMLLVSEYQFSISITGSPFFLIKKNNKVYTFNQFTLFYIWISYSGFWLCFSDFDCFFTNSLCVVYSLK